MREIRPYGSVRGVRRKPYPYRDNLLPMRSMARFVSFTFPHAASRRNRPAHLPPSALIASHSAALSRIVGFIGIAKARPIGGLIRAIIDMTHPRV